MVTSDGISGEDWDVLHGLAVELVNAADGDDEAACRATLMRYLDRLAAKYGERPSILATRADYTQDAETKERLLRRAYDLAEARGDAQNRLHVAHPWRSCTSRRFRLRTREDNGWSGCGSRLARRRTGTTSRSPCA
jgi:hypothetical protein